MPGPGVASEPPHLAPADGAASPGGGRAAAEQLRLALAEGGALAASAAERAGGDAAVLQPGSAARVDAVGPSAVDLAIHDAPGEQCGVATGDAASAAAAARAGVPAKASRRGSGQRRSAGGPAAPPGQAAEHEWQPGQAPGGVSEGEAAEERAGSPRGQVAEEGSAVPARGERSGGVDSPRAVEGSRGQAVPERAAGAVRDEGGGGAGEERGQADEEGRGAPGRVAAERGGSGGGGGSCAHTRSSLCSAFDVPESGGLAELWASGGSGGTADLDSPGQAGKVRFSPHEEEEEALSGVDVRVECDHPQKKVSTQPKPKKKKKQKSAEGAHSQAADPVDCRMTGLSQSCEQVMGFDEMMQWRSSSVFGNRDRSCREEAPRVSEAQGEDADSAMDAKASTAAPRELPSALPLRFRFDVPCARLGAAEGPERHCDMSEVHLKLEVAWLWLRLQQEQAWENDRRLPSELEKFAKKHGGDLSGLRETILCPTALEGRRQSMKKKRPMTVIALEGENHELLTAEDLDNLIGSMWIRLVCDFRHDPLMKELGFKEGHTRFVMTLLVYERHLSVARPDSATRELRFAHVESYDYAFVFPTLPYPDCELERPPEDLASRFPIDTLFLEMGAHQLKILEAKATLTWLFWDCFGALFNAQSGVSTPARSRVKLKRDSPASCFGGKRSVARALRYPDLGWWGGLRDCTTRDRAMGIVRARMGVHAFHLPMHCVVSLEEVSVGVPSAARRPESDVEGGSPGALHLDGDDLRAVLSAVELALHRAAVDLDANKDVPLPRSWRRVPRGPRWPLEIRPLRSADGKGETFDGVWEPVQPLIQAEGEAELVLGLVHCRAVLRQRALASAQDDVAEDPARSRSRPRLPGWATTAAADPAARTTRAHTTPISGEKPAGDGHGERVSVAEDEVDGDAYCEEKVISVTVDMSQWRSRGSLTVMEININHCWEICSVLQVVRELEHCADRCADTPAQSPEEERSRERLRERLAHLAFGLRALQRADIKQQMRDVGLAVMEVERGTHKGSRKCGTAVKDAWHNTQLRRDSGRRSENSLAEALKDSQDGQRVMLVTAPEGVLQRRAQQRGYVAKILPRMSSGQYLGGFDCRQFDREGPTEAFWVETEAERYRYRPYFRPHRPELDSAALLSPAERRYLVRSFITDSLSEVRFPDGSIDPSKGGANLDPQTMLEKDIITAFVPISDLHDEQRLMNEWVCPWRTAGLCGFLLRGLLRCCPERVVATFGPRVGAFFCFMETYTGWLVVPAVLGALAEVVGRPSEKQSFAWRGAQPLMAIVMPIWSACFCIYWRRRLAKLAYWWNNGWLELGAELQTHGDVMELGRVRPEFATACRSQLEMASKGDQAQILADLRRVLKASTAHETEPGPFCNKSLHNDIQHFDAACYISSKQNRFRGAISLLVVAVMVALSCAATALSLTLASWSKDWGFEQNWAYAFAGLLSAVLVAVLNLVQRMVAFWITDWQCLRDERVYEGALFMRIFLFNFFNTFNSLFYIALVSQDMEQLRVQALFLVVSLTFKENLQEMMLAVLLKVMGDLQQVAAGEASLYRDGLKMRMSRHSGTDGTPVSAALTQVSDQLARGGEFLLTDEEIEIAILHGMVLFFTLPCPLAPLIVLLGAFQEVRLDAYKLVKLQRLPDPRMLAGVGRTYEVLVFLTGFSLMFNAALLYVTRYAEQKTGMQILFPERTERTHLLSLFAMEHALLILFILLLQSSPVSAELRSEQFRQQYFENRKANEYKEEDEAAVTRGMLHRRARQVRRRNSLREARAGTAKSSSQ